ncbi:hypothetical protein VRB14_19775 [Pseudomonas trivialis]
MADYINKNILAQSYVHVEPKWLSKVSTRERLRQVDVIKSQITQYANERMQFFLHDGVVITVDFQEGFNHRQDYCLWQYHGAPWWSGACARIYRKISSL